LVRSILSGSFVAAQFSATQAVTPMKRAAQTKLVKMILLLIKQAGEKHASGE
jgi:hypothetical protein